MISKIECIKEPFIYDGTLKDGGGVLEQRFESHNITEVKRGGGQRIGKSR